MANRWLTTGSLTIALAAGLGVGIAAAENKNEPSEDRVRLKSGAEFSVQGLRRRGSDVWLLLSSDQIESIGGKPLPPPVAAGEKAPVFSVKDLDGKDITLPVPGKPTLLQFWASWCPFCRKDLQTVRDIQSAYGSHGLQVVGVSLDQDVDKLKAFLTQQPLVYPVVLSSAVEGNLHEKYDVTGLPTYCLIDAKGVIVQLMPGSVNSEDSHVGELTKAIRDTMKSAGLSLPAETSAPEVAAPSEKKNPAP